MRVRGLEMLFPRLAVCIRGPDIGFFGVAAPGGKLILKATVIESSRRCLSYSGLAISELLKIVMRKGEGGFKWLGWYKY
jgi:hypothetical protein